MRGLDPFHYFQLSILRHLSSQVPNQAWVFHSAPDLLHLDTRGVTETVAVKRGLAIRDMSKPPVLWGLRIRYSLEAKFQYKM